MTSSTAKNLEVIDAAIEQHNANCDAALIEIQMAPFEVDRLGWDEYKGIPIVADPNIGTGRFRLVCSGLHGDGPVAEVETVQQKEPLHV